jgi:sugar phosphate permease
MATTVSTPVDFEAATFGKVTRRLMSYLFLCYILAYLGRLNVSFAKLPMQHDLHMSDSVYGLGAGIFFIGYLFLQVPANLVMQRVGAKNWIGPTLAICGAVSCLPMLVRSPADFYAVRLLRGVVESGFFPGVILYLTYWYPSRYRARMVAIFMSGAALCGVVAGPFSGWVLANMQGVRHLAGWQWMFLLEGLPAVFVGLAGLYILTDGPAQATWLSDAEKALLLQRLREDEESKKRASGGSQRLSDTFRSRAVWMFALAYFGLNCANWGISFWMPQLINDTITTNPLAIGWITAIPWTFSGVIMILVGRHSDATGERRWHFALSMFVVTLGFAVSALPMIPGAVRLAAVSLAVAGFMSAFAVFWAMPTSILAGTAAAAGIAWINAIGNLGGYASPHLLGIIRDWRHSMTPALLLLSAVSLVSGAVALQITKQAPATKPLASGRIH